MMNAPYMQGYYQNPQVQQQMMQQNTIEQRLQALQNQLNNNNNSNPMATNKVVAVASAQEAQNAQIPMDGTVTYFVFGDTILAKNWSFATGRIENVYFKKFSESEPTVEKQPDRLVTIEAKLDKILEQYKKPSESQKDDSSWQEKLMGGKNVK